MAASLLLRAMLIMQSSQQAVPRAALNSLSAAPGRCGASRRQGLHAMATMTTSLRAEDAGAILTKAVILLRLSCGPHCSVNHHPRLGCAQAALLSPA